MKYSQYDEQNHIAEATAQLGGVGKFLDIGAWAAKDFSNTRALYERGWKGIMIEPSPEPFANLVKEYGSDPGITLICAAVGLAAGLMKFHATADCVGTLDDASFEQRRGDSNYYGSFLSCVITLEDIFNRFGGAFNFVNIDTEGSSAELALKMLKLGPRPECFCVEHDNRMTELAVAASDANYRLLYANGTNGVFGRNG